jgi:hypothetical protein
MSLLERYSANEQEEIRAGLAGMLARALAGAASTPFLLAALDLLDDETYLTADRMFLCWLTIPWTVRVDALRTNPGTPLTRFLQQVHTTSEFGAAGWR